MAKNDGWTDLSDSYFVLLGAGSAMGPFLVLVLQSFLLSLLIILNRHHRIFSLLYDNDNTYRHTINQ